MGLPPSFLDDLRRRLPPSAVIGRRVRLARKGREHLGLCPFHNEKTPSFTVNDDKGFFHCFGCGAHGDLIGFVMRDEGLSFPEAVERLAQEAGLEVPAPSPAERAREETRQGVREAVAAACSWFEAQLKAPAGRRARDYLAQRGVDDATIAAFRLGYAPDSGQALAAHLRAAGFADAVMVEAGLATQPEGRERPYDFFRGRLLFPILDGRGRPIAFGGRILGDGQPKYLNSRDTPLFDKSRTLYALDKAREGLRHGAELVLVEGYMDVIALHQAGFRGAVAPLGTALTEPQLEELWRHAAEPILCFDGDRAGRQAALRAAERALPLLKAGCSLRFALLPEGEDPDSLIRRHGPEGLTPVLGAARPMAELIWEAELAVRLPDTPERKADLQQRLDKRAALIADREVQQHYRRQFRDWFWQRAAGRKPFGGRPGRGQTDETAMGGGPAGRLPLPARDGRLSARQSQLVIVTLLNHPALAEELGEALVGLSLADPDLERLLRAVLSAVEQAIDLDRETLQNQLKEIGLADIVTRALQPDLYRLWPFSGPRASLSEARQGLEHIVELSLQRRIGGEIDAAERDLARQMSEASWERLKGLQRMRRLVEDDGGAEEDGQGSEEG